MKKQAGLHSLIIVDDTPTTWKIKNSWGTVFADIGYFNVNKDTFEIDKLTFLYLYHEY